MYHMCSYGKRSYSFITIRGEDVQSDDIVDIEVSHGKKAKLEQDFEQLFGPHY